MATISHATPNQSGSNDEVIEVWVEYDEINDGVTVNPTQLHKDTVVRFRNPKGHKLRIEFLTPSGNDCDMVTDSQIYRLTVGGTYHFKCFFMPPGEGGEISPTNGGVIDVMPQRP